MFASHKLSISKISFIAVSDMSVSDQKKNRIFGPINGFQKVRGRKFRFIGETKLWREFEADPLSYISK